MLTTMLGFGGRIGRLRYLLATIVLGVVMTIVCMVLVFSQLRLRSVDELMPTILVIAPLFFWASAALMAKRFRDIGWRPRYVLPAWAAIWLIDTIVAGALPMLAVGDGEQTPVGLVVNLGLVLALLLWPGRAADDGDRFDTDAIRRGYREAGLAAAPTPAPAATSRRAAPAAAGGFGRRGL